MNLRKLVNSATSTVNPNQIIVWRRSGGYTTDPAGKRTEVLIDKPVSANIQALSGGDLKHIDGLNIQGTLRSVYIYENIQGIVRADQKGGDMLVFPQRPNDPPNNWRVVAVAETWPDWSKVVVCLQA